MDIVLGAEEHERYIQEVHLDWLGAVGHALVNTAVQNAQNLVDLVVRVGEEAEKFIYV